MNYPIADTFYSLKGEGQWTGTPMFFIRLAGCNLACEFCDTDFTKRSELSTEELVGLAEKHDTKHVVITGGEPLIHNLDKLIGALHSTGKEVHIETNGTLLLSMSNMPDWVAVSPKPRTTLFRGTMEQASEIKYLVGLPNWEQYIETVEGWHALSPDCIRYVMPVARDSQFDLRLGNDGDVMYRHGWRNKHNTQLAVDYCLKHPNFRLCLQVHKYLSIQ